MNQNKYDVFYSELTTKEPPYRGIGFYLLKIFFFIIFPIAGFVFADMQTSESVNYQHETARIGLLFSIRYSWPLLPLYIWSLFTFMSQKRYGKKDRLIQYGGAWAGALFALSQCLFFISTESGSTIDEIFILTISAIPVGFVYALISTSLNEEAEWQQLIKGTLIVTLPLIILILLMNSSAAFSSLYLILFQTGIPVFYLIYSLTYIIRRSVKEKSVPDQVPALAVPALISYGGWQAALALSLKAYSELPPTPPSCYIATAAAKGHSSFVGSSSVECKNGEIFGVNEQLQVGKLFELYLKARVPEFHRHFRKLYDFIGPKIAEKISSPVKADLAWIILKPFELIAKGVLSVSVKGWRENSSGIYGK